MSDIQHEDAYLELPFDGDDVSYSYLSELKSMHEEGFKFFIPKDCRPLKDWIEKNKLQYHIVGNNFNDETSVRAVAVINNQRYCFVITAPEQLAT